jgi:hypothetical protein
MQGGQINIDLFAYCLFLHVMSAVWIGLLASRWKGRSAWRWFAASLFGSLFALILLAMAERQLRPARVEADMELQHMDGTSLLR